VISLGTNLLPDVVKKPLSMGADELILLEDEAFAGVMILGEVKEGKQTPSRLISTFYF
jgi:electron transfer flavoprotein alpha/beta subunit